MKGFSGHFAQYQVKHSDTTDNFQPPDSCSSVQAHAAHAPAPSSPDPAKVLGPQTCFQEVAVSQSHSTERTTMFSENMLARADATYMEGKKK